MSSSLKQGNDVDQLILGIKSWDAEDPSCLLTKQSTMHEVDDDGAYSFTFSHNLWSLPPKKEKTRLICETLQSLIGSSSPAQSWLNFQPPRPPLEIDPSQ